MKRIRKAVFPAAGLGTRFLPATKSMPKEMLNLVDKPLIQYTVEEAIASGCTQLVIVTGRDKSPMEDHFDVSYELERTLEDRNKTELLELARSVADLASIAYIRQKRPLGLGHAVLVTKRLVGDEPFAVILPDDIVDSEKPAVAQLAEVAERYEAPVIGVIPIDGPEISRFGVAAGEEVEPGVFKITKMVEKPKFEEAPSNLAIVGRYVLTPDIFAHLEATGADTRGEIQLTDGMQRLLGERPMYARVLEGTRHDGGDKLGYLLATFDFALKRPDLGPELIAFLRERLARIDAER
ncbi:MAG: UTP--glucose-1-phosphate uridylyltransferase GalU [Acidobacteria bacterium]|nr:UTP--glucose-1-phosphate uridylyltransferase GalU [Acidobacteriota bacterium]